MLKIEFLVVSLVYKTKQPLTQKLRKPQMLKMEFYGCEFFGFQGEKTINL